MYHLVAPERYYCIYLENLGKNQENQENQILFLHSSWKSTTMDLFRWNSPYGLSYNFLLIQLMSKYIEELTSEPNDKGSMIDFHKASKILTKYK